MPRSPLPSEPIEYDAAATATILTATEPLAQPVSPSVVTMEAETLLLAMIDSWSINDGERVPLQKLKRCCMDVPHLSLLLNGPRRYKLYTQLLFNVQDPLPEVDKSFAGDANKATKFQKDTASKLCQLFDDPALTTEEFQGFLHCFMSRTGTLMDTELTSVVLTAASVVKEAGLTSPHEIYASLYHLLGVLVKDYVVSSSALFYKSATVRLLRLFLQYHDPELSTHIDHRMVEVGAYLFEWVRRLFAVDNHFSHPLALWDWLIIVGDPVLTPFVAVAFLISHRQRILQLTSKEQIEDFLASVELTVTNMKPEAEDDHAVDGRPVTLMTVWSGKSLLQNATLIFRNTPLSSQHIMEFSLFPSNCSINKSPEALEKYYAATPCLPLERSDIGRSFPLPGAHEVEMGASIEYIVIDCRSRESFDYARLPTAVFVGDEISYDTSKLANLLERVRPSKGSHLAIFGTGRPILDELNLLKIVALYFVQNGFPYVSLMVGGFKATIPLIRAKKIRLLHSAGFTLGDHPPAPVVAGATHVRESLASAVSSISEFLPHVSEEQKTEVWQRAGDFVNKAKNGMLAARLWGLGRVQRVQGPTITSHDSPTASYTEASVEGTLLTESRTDTPLQGRVVQPAAAPPKTPRRQQVFTLGDDESDGEDFGLITNVASDGVHTSPSNQGKPLNASQPQTRVDPNLYDVAESVPSNSTVSFQHPPSTETESDATKTAIASQFVARMDAELEELFGDSSPVAPPAADVRASSSPPPLSTQAHSQGNE